LGTKKTLVGSVVNRQRDISFDNTRAGHVRLVLQRFKRGWDEFETPQEDASGVSLLTLEQERTLGANPIRKVEAITFFLGAASASVHRKQGDWFWRPEWVFLDVGEARSAMEAEYRAARLVRVFSLPGLLFHMGDELTLLVTELNTEEPFRDAYYKLKPTYKGVATRSAVSAYFRDGKFHPNTLRDTVKCFRSETLGTTRKSWLFCLMFFPGIPNRDEELRVLRPLGLAYRVFCRGFQRKPPPGKRLVAGLGGHGWTLRTIGTAGNTKARESPGAAIDSVPFQFDRYVRLLLAATHT